MDCVPLIGLMGKVTTAIGHAQLTGVRLGQERRMCCAVTPDRDTRQFDVEVP